VKLTISQKYKLKQFTWITTIGIVIGFLYPSIEDGWGEAFPLINGTLAGFIIGILVASLELLLFTGNLRRIPFTQIFMLRVGIYFILAFFITFGIFLFSRMFRFDLSYSEVLRSDEFQNYLSNYYHLVLIFCFLVIALCVFTLQMARKLGFSNLVAFITGKYRSPRKQNRIFMFISLGGIDEIIRRTGNMALHNFINDFIHDMSDTIRIHRGTLTQYMEDEIVITWRFKTGIENANCIRTYFHLCHEIVGHFEEYYSKYGLLPKPKCAIHAGSVIKAEIGEIKSEISFFGDVINTTSRILHEGVKRGIDILVSQSVMDVVELPRYFKTQARGSFTARGKKNSIQLFSLHINRE